jgi:hypothetical protein
MSDNIFFDPEFFVTGRAYPEGYGSECVSARKAARFTYTYYLLPAETSTTDEDEEEDKKLGGQKSAGFLLRNVNSNHLHTIMAHTDVVGAQEYTPKNLEDIAGQYVGVLNFTDYKNTMFGYKGRHEKLTAIFVDMVEKITSAVYKETLHYYLNELSLAEEEARVPVDKTVAEIQESIAQTNATTIIQETLLMVKHVKLALSKYAECAYVNGKADAARFFKSSVYNGAKEEADDFLGRLLNKSRKNTTWHVFYMALENAYLVNGINSVDDWVAAAAYRKAAGGDKCEPRFPDPKDGDDAKDDNKDDFQTKKDKGEGGPRKNRPTCDPDVPQQQMSSCTDSNDQGGVSSSKKGKSSDSGNDAFSTTSTPQGSEEKEPKKKKKVKEKIWDATTYSKKVPVPTFSFGVYPDTPGAPPQLGPLLIELEFAINRLILEIRVSYYFRK